LGAKRLRFSEVSGPAGDKFARDASVASAIAIPGTC
jgi:hypothetical protein